MHTHSGVKGIVADVRSSILGLYYPCPWSFVTTSLPTCAVSFGAERSLSNLAQRKQWKAFWELGCAPWCLDLL